MDIRVIQSANTNLEEILLRAGPLGAEPVVVVFVRGTAVEQLVVGVEGEVEPGHVDRERGVEPGRGGRRRGRGGRHGALAPRPRAPAPRPLLRRALSARRASIATRRHETIQLGPRFQYYQLHHHALRPTPRMSCALFLPGKKDALFFVFRMWL